MGVRVEEREWFDIQGTVLWFLSLLFSHQPLSSAVLADGSSAARVQQAAAFQLNWKDFSDPKQSVATSDRTLPVLPSSSLLRSLCPCTLPPTPPLLGAGRTGESGPHSAGKQERSRHKRCPVLPLLSVWDYNHQLIWIKLNLKLDGGLTGQ